MTLFLTHHTSESPRPVDLEMPEKHTHTHTHTYTDCINTIIPQIYSAMPLLTLTHSLSSTLCPPASTPTLA